MVCSFTLTLYIQFKQAAQRSFDRSSVPPESVLLIELLEEVNATVPASHFRSVQYIYFFTMIEFFWSHCVSKTPGHHRRANNIGPPPSLKGAATALLWLIQPEVLKHFPLYQVVRRGGDIIICCAFLMREKNSDIVNRCCRFLSCKPLCDLLCVEPKKLLCKSHVPLYFIFYVKGNEIHNCALLQLFF